MNRRIELTEIADRMRARLPLSLDIHRIGCAADTDFMDAVGNPDNWPGVWVGGQRSTPLGDGNGFSQRIAQEVRVEIVVRVIVPKHVDGETNQERRLNDISDAVADALIGWRPAGAAKALVWVSSTDGPPEQTVMTADLVFSTQVSYQYAAAAAT